MSIEQWGALALLVVLLLLEGVARLRRTVTSKGGLSDGFAYAPTPRRELPVPNRDDDSRLRGPAQVARPTLAPQAPLPAAVSQSAISLSGLSASHVSTSARSGSLATHRGHQKPLRADGMVQRLRPARNLRHAIVAATILGPPTARASATDSSFTKSWDV